jgi:hypothetical protein
VNRFVFYKNVIDNINCEVYIIQLITKIKEKNDNKSRLAQTKENHIALKAMVERLRIS